MPVQSMRLNLIRLCLIAALSLNVSCLYARPNKAHSQSKPSVPTTPHRIELQSDLDTVKNAQLQALIERFNAVDKHDGQIVLVAREGSNSPIPHMLILSDEEAENLLQQPSRFRPLWQIMRAAGDPLTAASPPAMMTPLPLDSHNRLLALPIGLSTPVTFFNEDLLKQVGIAQAEIPQTWQGWQNVFGKIYSQGLSTCPYTTAYPAWIFLENTSAWHNQAFVQTSGKNEKPVFNGLMQVKHLATMSSWYKARYLHIFGRGAEAEEKFSAGDCAVITTTSASLLNLQQKANFKIGIAPLPYHEGAYGAPQNTLATGSSLWISSGKSARDYKTIAHFVSFWLQHDNQVAWQIGTGFLPLNQAGLVAAHSKLEGDQFLIQRTALAELLHKNTTRSSQSCSMMFRPGMRKILDEELEALWADKKPAKQALDDAVARMQLACCKR